MDTRYVSTGKASQIIGVHPNTLRRWADEGRIKSWVPGGGRKRRFDISSLRPKDFDENEEPERVDIIYGRVSTRGQKEHLQTQVQMLVNKFGERCQVITDIASGLNFRRVGFNK
eukprot:2036290-Rhodomonas_salina.1